MSTYEEIQETMFTCEKGQCVKFKRNGVHVGCEIFSTDGKSMLIGFYPKGGGKIGSTIKNALGCIEDAELWIPDPLLQQKSAVYIRYEAELTKEAAKTFNDILCSANDKLVCENSYALSVNILFMKMSQNMTKNRLNYFCLFSPIGASLEPDLVSTFGGWTSLASSANLSI